MLNIAIVNTLDGGGGATRIALDVRECVHAAGHKATFFCGTPPLRKDSIHLMGRTDWVLGRTMKRIGYADAFSFAATRFLSHSLVSEADIVHFHNLHGFYFGMLSVPNIAAHKPCVWTLHDFWPLTGGCYYTFGCQRWREHCGKCPQHAVFPMVGIFDTSGGMHAIKRRALRAVVKNGAIVCPSEWLASSVRSVGRIPDDRVVVINNAVNTDVYTPDIRDSARTKFGFEKEDICLLILAGALNDRRKGMRYAIEAFQKTRVKDNLVVLSAGGGDVSGLEAALKSIRYKHLGFLNSQKDLARLYAAADFFVLPSLEDNFPMTVLEAMACGTPTVAFDVGGVGEQIVDGETGFVVPAKDSSALAFAIRRLISDRELCLKMRTLARQRAERYYSMKLFGQRHLSLYNDVLADWQARRLMEN